MAMVDGDWTIDRGTGDIRYTGSVHGGSPLATYATVIEFHRWIQAFADDASSGTSDDEHDITDATASDRSTNNIITLLGSYNIDDTSAQHLYDGSIIQGTGGSEVIYDGIVNFGNADVQIQIHQDGAVLADDWWNQIDTSVSPDVTIGLNADAGQGISHRFMIKTKTAGADIDGRRLIGTARRWGKTFSEFKINGTARGNNVLALTDADDLNNTTAAATVEGWTGITNTTEGYANIDINNDGNDEFYYSEWNTNQPTRTINEFYERMKWLTYDGQDDYSPAFTVYGLAPELFRGITHQIQVDNILTGPLSAVETLTWTEATISSSGRMLATNSVSAPTQVWIQLLTGIVPTDGTTLTGVTSSATVDVDTNIIERAITAPFIGQSTGSAIIGAYGVGIEYLDLSDTDSVTALDATPYSPPNNVTFTVNGLVADETYVLATNDDAGDIDYDQLSLGTTLNADDITEIHVVENIPLDTPATGYIRVADDNGVYRRLHYTNWNTSPNTFDIDTTDGNEDFASVNATAANNVFISYLDKLAEGSPDGSIVSESFIGTYSGDRTIFVRARDGGATPLKTAETTGTNGTNGGSATITRISDA